MRQAIESVLQQEFGDFELLVVDDGSMDDTANVVREMQNHDDRLCYINIPHRGVGFARETGLRHSRGELIAWIDADDLWLPGKLQNQVSIMLANPEVEILFTDWWNIDYAREMKELGFSQNGPALQLLRSTKISDSLFQVQDGMCQALLLESVIHFQTVIFRTAVLDKVGGIDASLAGAEDFEFFWRASIFDATFAFLDYPTVERHKQDSGITSNKAFSWRETLRALDRCLFFAEKTGRHDLLQSIRKSQKRAILNLLWEYGIKKDRLTVLSIYRSSFETGFSAHISFIALAAWLGPRVLMLLEQRRKR